MQQLEPGTGGGLADEILFVVIGGWWVMVVYVDDGGWCVCVHGAREKKYDF
jgi:hypothetical protein